MTIIQSNSEARIEVAFHVERSDDGNALTVVKTTRISPVSGDRVMWSKSQDHDEQLFTVSYDLVPDLLKALGTGLSIGPGEHV